MSVSTQPQIHTLETSFISHTLIIKLAPGLCQQGSSGDQDGQGNKLSLRQTECILVRRNTNKKEFRKYLNVICIPLRRPLTDAVFSFLSV